MINKIRSIEQLKDEKNRIKRKEADLENKIRTEWLELRGSLLPGGLRHRSKGKSGKKEGSNFSQDSILKRTLIFGATLFVQKFADKALEKLVEYLNKNKSSSQ